MLARVAAMRWSGKCDGDVRDDAVVWCIDTTDDCKNPQSIELAVESFDAICLGADECAPALRGGRDW